MAAAAAALAIVWRRTRSPAALAWLGLHPVFGAIAVNGGHIDVLIGLGILVAALFASQERGVIAGIVIGVVALMKLTSLLALVGIVLWAWRRRNARLAGRVMIAAGATLALGYVPVLTSASRVLGTADRTVTPASAWNALAEALVGHDAGRRLAHPLAPNSTLTVLFYLSLGAVAAIALAVGWHAARTRRPEPAVGATTASYTMAAAYSYPWYSAWALPTLSDHQPSQLAWVVWLQASLMLAALKLPVIPSSTVVGIVTRGSAQLSRPARASRRVRAHRAAWQMGLANHCADRFVTASGVSSVGGGPKQLAITPSNRSSSFADVERRGAQHFDGRRRSRVRRGSRPASVASGQVAHQEFGPLRRQARGASSSRCSASEVRVWIHAVPGPVSSTTSPSRQQRALPARELPDLCTHTIAEHDHVTGVDDERLTGDQGDLLDRRRSSTRRGHRVP